ncbi:MAG: cyclopropane-fatty-acyl-phospholipid synthase family protein [Acidobacteriota bacterium]
MSAWERLLERDLFPDWLIRIGIRQLLRRRERDEAADNWEQRKAAYLNTWRSGAVAVHTQDANRQHYEVPPRFYELVLGPRRKYSSAFYPEGRESLAEAEEAMLSLTCERAGLADGQRVLELGCGWGSLSLYMAERYPASSIRVVSNSRTQREYIEAAARARGLNNLQVATRDMVSFDPAEPFGEAAQFDRVVSVEMFEHMRNWRELLRRISTWLSPEGQLFIHIFCHERFCYPFEVRDSTDWMAEHFFTGGIMPSFDQIERMSEHLTLEQSWRVNGMHYWRTSEDWLQRLDENREEVMRLFESTYGKDQALKWVVRWRVFFLACAELFRHKGGAAWFVGHYLLRKPL